MDKTFIIMKKHVRYILLNNININTKYQNNNELLMNINTR
jgi:hypothetical protein